MNGEGRNRMISVIMLTYNRASMVTKMIDCVLSQSLTEFEYIIIDNGSTDNTAEILEEYQSEDSRIKVVRSDKPLTIGAARNIGISHATGDYITFVDDDDRLSPEYLQYLFGLITEFDAQIAVAGTEEEENGVIRPQCTFSERECLSGEEAVCELLQRKRIRAGTAAKMILRTIAEKYPFPENSYHEDIHVTYKFLGEAERVAMGGKPIYRCLRHGGNVSSFTSDRNLWTEEKLQEYITAFKEREAYIADRFLALEEYARYSTYSYEISMCRQLLDDPPEGAEDILQKMYFDIQVNLRKILRYPFLSTEEKTYLSGKRNELEIP